MRYQYPRPGNEDEFEDFCVRFYRHLLKREGLVRYAKRGEAQDGIDIIDQHGLKPLFAIQCKRHEPTKTIPPKEIKDEVAKAEASLHKLDRYVIATTAKKSKRAQDAVLQLNQRPDHLRPFMVEIHFWEDICTDLSEFGKAVAEFIFWGEQRLENVLDPISIRGGSYGSSETSETATAQVDSYPDIDALFAKRKLEIAEYEINKLPDPERDPALATGRRYAILRLKAKLALEQSQFDEAVRLFTLAYETCPELPQARHNRVLALEFSGGKQQAFAEAATLLDHGTRSSFLIALLVRTASVADDLVPYQHSIDEFAHSEEDVNIALVMKYLEWNQLAPADAAACRAAKIAPDSAHSLFSCGMVSHHAALKGDWRHRRAHLVGAVSYYSDALVAATRENYAGLLPEIYINRARVNAVAGRLADAAMDFRSAVSVSNRPSLYAEAAASFFLHAQDYNSAREFLPVLDPTSDEAQFLTAITECHQAPKDEKISRIEALAQLADRPFDRAMEARFHCVQGAIELRDLALARQCVPQSFVDREPLQGNTMLAWVELEAGNADKARDFAARALDSSSRSAHQQEISVLGRLLVRLGEDEKALPLLEQAATTGELDDDTKRLIECAQRLKRHDTLLRICAELRETNQQDNVIRRLEVELLSHYAPERAFALATQFRGFDEPYFTAARNFLAVRLGKTEEIEFDNDTMPSPDEFAPDEAYLIVTPYVETGRYRDALVFAYQQLRKYFSDERAHGQYIWYVLHYGKKAALSQPEVIDEESAVRLENLTTQQHRWIVVEEDAPDSARNEFAPSSQVAQTLIGRKVGDVVDVRGPSVQVQQEGIVEIQSKYVRVFQDAMSNFQHRFPGAGSIQSVHVGSGDHFDPTPLIDSLNQRREHVDKITAFYHENLCSLHFLAKQLGINVRQLMRTLTAHDTWFVRCVDCSPEELAHAVAAGGNTNRIVLDLSAIVTIARLGAWDQLDRGSEYLVSQATSDTIAGWLHELTEQESKPVGYSCVTDDGRLYFQEASPEQWQKECDEVASIVQEMNALCTVRSSMAIASLAPKRREQYAEVLGFHTLEAVSIAKDENATLWTDDLFVGMIAEIDFGVKRIWTQLAFKLFELAKRVENDEGVSQISAKLAAWNYISTIWTPKDVVSAGDLCGWDVNAWPLKECMQLIGKCPVPVADRAQLAMQFFRLLRRSSCSEFKQSAVCQATLDAVGNAGAVRWMLGRLDQFFAIDVPSAKFLKCELGYWLHLR